MVDHRGKAPADVAHELHQRRRQLLEALEQLPEARLYRPLPREGWTLRHELSALAAADFELLHLIERARDGRAPSAPQLRRLRGEAMHRAHEQRLSGIRSVLAEHGERISRALERTSSSGTPAWATPDIDAYLERYDQHTRAALQAVTDATGAGDPG